MCNLFAKYVKILDICKHFSENLVNSIGNVPRCGVVPRFSDLEVVALAMTAEAEGYDSENLLFKRLEEFKSQMPNLISRRQFNDRRKLTSGLCESIRKRMVDAIDGGEDCFCIDSMPVSVCKLARAKRCKMGADDFETAPDFGYCASQGVYYYGFKLNGLCGLSGVIHSYDMSKASVHDIRYTSDIRQTHHDCCIIGDKCYISADIQLDLFETAHIRLECPCRANQKDWKPTFAPFAKARRRIETVFSQLDDQFMMKRNYAKKTRGLFTRVIGKVSAFTALQYINSVNGRPVSQVKYAIYL